MVPFAAVSTIQISSYIAQRRVWICFFTQLFKQKNISQDGEYSCVVELLSLCRMVEEKAGIGMDSLRESSGRGNGTGGRRIILTKERMSQDAT